ncbi:hypothetical protein SANTM175S_07029 [Streptomyces antimycoticus]
MHAAQVGIVEKVDVAGRTESPKAVSTAPMASGMEPRCTGQVLACAITRPEASHSAAEKSMLEATIWECAVRRMVIAISSASPVTAFR